MGIQTMTDPSGVDEVVERLRTVATCIYIAVEEPVADDIAQKATEAADLLTAQAARIAELEGDVADLDMNVEAAAELILAGSAREVAAEAEAQKLRAERDEAVGLLRILATGTYLERNDAINHGVPAFIAKHGGSIG